MLCWLQMLWLQFIVVVVVLVVSIVIPFFWVLIFVVVLLLLGGCCGCVATLQDVLSLKTLVKVSN